MELHDALSDLAGTVTDDPHRLASVHARYRRHRRTRVAVTAASTAGVVGAAVVGGVLAFSPSSSVGHQRNLAAGAVWVDVATSRGAQSAVDPKVAKLTCTSVPAPAGGAMRPATGPPPISQPEPLSPPTWTGTPPPPGVPFSLNGTVTATTNDSFTITVPDGASEGSFVFSRAVSPSVCDLPGVVVGSEAHIAGTRTGSDTYDFSSVAERVYPNS